MVIADLRKTVRQRHALRSLQRHCQPKGYSRSQNELCSESQHFKQLQPQS
jgi:hypothetical protein